jgi:hypothetical protein
LFGPKYLSSSKQASEALIYFQPAGAVNRRRAMPIAWGLNNPKEVQNHQYGSEHEQSMDPTTGLWEAWADIPSEESKQP